MTEQELSPQGDLLPPWKQHPELDRYAIGWRMGAGESYMLTWDQWSQTLNAEQLIDYFKRHVPIPFEWLDWVARRCGYVHYDNSEVAKLAEIQWLEQQGLVNFSEYLFWYGGESVWEGYLSSLKTMQPNLVIPAVSHDIIEKLFNILHTARMVEQAADTPSNTEHIKEFIASIQGNSFDILFIVNALQRYNEQS